MKRNLFIVWSIFAGIGILHGQAKYAPDTAINKIAAFLSHETSYRFINTVTHDTLSDLDTASVQPDIQFASSFADWTYPNGVMLYGMIASGKSSYSLRTMQCLFHSFDYFKKQWELTHRNKGATEYKLHRMESLDDCGSMGAALIEAYLLNPDEQWRRTIERIADYISTKQSRLQDGTLCRTVPHKMTVWGDDLYMSVPFLARMGSLTHDTSYYHDAVRQVEQFYHLLFQPETGLAHHGYYTDTQQPTVAFWGRANGWMLVAATELLRELPQNFQGRDSIVHLVQNHVRGLTAHQDTATGLWRQVIDKRESYLETSCSAMFVYTLATGINNGWLDSSYAGAARRGWEGIAARITPEGHILGTCAGTSIGDSLQFYYDRPTPENDPHAFGPVLLAASAMKQLK